MSDEFARLLLKLSAATEVVSDYAAEHTYEPLMEAAVDLAEIATALAAHRAAQAEREQSVTPVFRLSYDPDHKPPSIMVETDYEAYFFPGDAGHVRYYQAMLNAIVEIAQRHAQAERDDTCPECQGAGEYGLPDPLDGGEEPYLCDECRGTGKRPAPALATDACPGCATWKQALDQHRRQEHGEQARDYQPDYEGALTIVDKQANRLADLLLKTRQQRDEAERLLERIIATEGAAWCVCQITPCQHDADYDEALEAARRHVAARRAARGEAD